MVLDWPVTDERITGISAVVAVHAEHPRGTAVRLLRLVADGSDVAAEVAAEVELTVAGASVVRIASFWTVRDGLLAQGREYWTSPASQPAPAWRAPYVLPLSVAEQE